MKTDKNAYIACSMYYMRRYFGLREILLIGILLILGILLYAFTKWIFILILFGVTIALLLFVLMLFIWTAFSGYKVDVRLKNIKNIRLDFGENILKATSENMMGQAVMEEEFKYEKLEKVVIRRNYIYIYAMVSVFFYISKAEIGIRESAELDAFLHEKLSAEKFKFKKTVRMFPKKKKIKINGNKQ